MECEIVVRPAREQDRQARAELIKEGITTYDVDAIIYFIFQEVTLQACVLLGAVLFIFCGAGPTALALLPPTLALLVGLAVLAVHRHTARVQIDRLQWEDAGFVAECLGPDSGAGGIVVIVGTVSVHGDWVSALAVRAGWRRRGAGRGLVSACCARALAAGLPALCAAASALQPAPRLLMLSAGWEVRGTYSRRVVGELVTLPMMQLVRPLLDP